MARDTSDRLLPARLLPTSTRASWAPDGPGRASVGRLLHGQTTGFGGPPRRAAEPLTSACSRRRCRPRHAPRERDPAAKALGCPRAIGASAPRCPFEHPARAAPVRRLGRRRLRLSKPLPSGMPESRHWADRRPRPYPVPEGKGASFGLGLAYRSLAAFIPGAAAKRRLDATHERAREPEAPWTSESPVPRAARVGGLAAFVTSREPIVVPTSRKARAPARFEMSAANARPVRERGAFAPRARPSRGPITPSPQRHCSGTHITFVTSSKPPAPDAASNRCGSTAACSSWPKPA